MGPDPGDDVDIEPEVAFDPSNIARALVEAGTEPLVLDSPNGAIDIDTDLGTISVAGAGDARPAGVAFNVVQQAGNPGIAVFSATSLDISANTEVRVTGTAALVFAINGDVAINGTLNAVGGRGQPFEPGPGGFVGGNDEQLAGLGPGGAPAAIEGDIDVGGGGAGHLAAGGKGGDRADDAGGLPGQLYGAGALSPLIGGSGGAKGGGDNGGPGGGGGGAVQITAFGDVVIGAGGIRCGGGGGQSSADDDGGGGGGSGGAILIEASSVTISGGILAANGGGGGSGANDNDLGNAGAAGALNASPAPGGATAGEGTAGGNGGAGDSAAGQAGVDANGTEDVSDNAGGGGGAGGRIFIRARNLAIDGAIVSPQAGLETDLF